MLAQAAMTRQFDVKDEIEVKDDLDKKPDKPATATDNVAASETDTRITRSVQNFLARFKTIDSEVPVCSSHDFGLERKTLFREPDTSFDHDGFAAHIPLDQILTVTNLPRAGLDTLLASEAQ